MDNLIPYDRIKLPLLKKCCAILRLDEASTYAILEDVMNVMLK